MMTLQLIPVRGRKLCRVDRLAVAVHALQLIPARGRKPVAAPAAAEGKQITTYPRKGTETHNQESEYQSG